MNLITRQITRKIAPIVELRAQNTKNTVSCKNSIVKTLVDGLRTIRSKYCLKDGWNVVSICHETNIHPMAKKVKASICHVHT